MKAPTAAQIKNLQIGQLISIPDLGEAKIVAMLGRIADGQAHIAIELKFDLEPSGRLQ